MTVRDLITLKLHNPGRVLLEISCTIRTAEDGVIALGPCLEKADEIEDRHGHSLGSGIMNTR